GVARHTGDDPLANPLFQAMFVLQATPADVAARIGGLEITEETVHSGTAKVDLTCMLRADGGDGLTGELEYSAAVMDGAGAAHWLAAYEALLDGAVGAPRTRVDELPLLAPAERDQRTAAVNADREEPGGLRPLHLRFEETARRTPDAVAIEAGSATGSGRSGLGARTVTYAELDRRAERLALALAAAGAGPEKLVGICADRSPDLIVALLATLRTGAGFIPLDPAMPLERMRAITEDARPVALVTQRPHLPLLEPLGTPLVVESAEPAEPAEPTEPAEPAEPTEPTQPTGRDTAGTVDGTPRATVPVGLDNVAYVYYTSGSTGRPKGVVIDHRCAANRVDWIARRYAMGPGTRVLHKTPLLFDVAIWEIFSTLGHGGTVLLADAGAEADVTHLAGLLTDGRPALAHFVPSMLDAYLSLAPRANLADTPSPRWIQTSGEGVPARLLRRFAAHFHAPVELHNMYGQTETSEVAAWEGRVTSAPAAVPMGRQIGIYRLFVLDEALNPLPPGVRGELYVAGIGGLARGYHGRPGLTAEKFVPNPYALTPGERLYRTGDLAWTDREGALHYAGRSDDQAKIRGVRVETGEIESVLERHPGVRASAVVVRRDGRDGGGAPELVAYVVGDASAGELAEHLARYLTTYMLPAAYVRLDALPLTPSGKTDRLRLPAPTAADREARVGAAEPHSELESALAELWKDVLGVGRVGRKDNFFGVGGNSLSSLQVLNRVNETFGVEVSLREFFGAPTIEGLAAYVEKSLVSMVSGLSDDEVADRLNEGGLTA
ncbi:amino acid adenylation domain-containing protein, partial [Streptomyces daliensis]|nr:amino acid adenylation domain-containing protein [Streptomyces daliensis]